MDYFCELLLNMGYDQEYYMYHYIGSNKLDDHGYISLWTVQ